MRGVRRASTTQATAPPTGYCDGLRCSGSLLATLLDLLSADLAKTRPLLTCCRSSHDNVRRCHDWTMTCRDAKRGEQASTSRVKAADSMSVLGRMPSDMLHASREEWQQDQDSPRGRRRKTWSCIWIAERPCHGRPRPPLKAPSGSAHSHMSRECGRHLCHETACRVREPQGRVGRGRLRRRFLTLVLRKCTNYSYN